MHVKGCIYKFLYMQQKSKVTSIWASSRWNSFFNVLKHFFERSFVILATVLRTFFLRSEVFWVCLCNSWHIKQLQKKEWHEVKSGDLAGQGISPPLAIKYTSVSELLIQTSAEVLYCGGAQFCCQILSEGYLTTLENSQFLRIALKKSPVTSQSLKK